MLKRIIIWATVIFSFSGNCFALPPAGQEISTQEKTREAVEAEKALREKTEKPKQPPVIEETAPEKEVIPESAEKILVKNITVIGVTILSEGEVKEIISPFENKELTLKEIQKAADLITDAYRKKGYVTSRAYIPPQKIDAGILEIRVLEAATGEIQIKGNRFFKTGFLRKKISLKKSEPFNYNILQGNLMRINAHPDRRVKAVLAPGRDPGTTDIILEVKDNLPVHIGESWDNFASRYLRRNRYTTVITNNNFLGWDDRVTLQYQLADAEDYRLASLRYVFPVNEDLDIGFFMAKTKMSLGREYTDLMARGKSSLFNLYAVQTLLEQDKFIINLNLGFDYKDIFNFQLGNETSRDRLRVIKAGLDLDITDNLGRTFITEELDYGIPEMLGGLKRQDIRASRSGSGGKFFKENLNLFRLQKMPFNSSLLWKNQCQFSPYILTAAEQFQFGGIANLRGYPPAEYVGDQGYAMSWEWFFPVYFLNREIKIPFSQGKLYDSVKIMGFYDWTNGHLRRPQAGEEKNKTLRAAGCGIRFNLPENFFARFEIGWPLDNLPSDGKHAHKWVEISKSF